MTHEQFHELHKLAEEVTKENDKAGLTDKVKQMMAEYYEKERQYSNTTPQPSEAKQ